MKFKTARHKFFAKRTVKNGIKFPSKLESEFYQRLLFLQQAGQVLFFLRQIGVDLEAGARHFVDFLIFMPQGHAVFLECKGRAIDLPLGKLKRKQAEERLGVEIKVAHSIQELDAAIRES